MCHPMYWRLAGFTDVTTVCAQLLAGFRTLTKILPPRARADSWHVQHVPTSVLTVLLTTAYATSLVLDGYTDLANMLPPCNFEENTRPLYWNLQ